MTSVRKLTTLATLTAVALTIFVVEAQLPPIIPVPGIKLGLANLVVLATVVCLGTREAAVVQMLRIVLGGFLLGQGLALCYSLVGGIFCLSAMHAALWLCRNGRLWAVSIIGAIAHNAGQLLVASLVVQSVQILWYGPVLLLSAIVTGAFTGLCVQLFQDKLKKYLNKVR